MLIKIDVNLPDKTVFSYKNWNQSLNVHLAEYRGLSKLYVDIILVTLYISLCGDPLCILVNEYLCLSFITMCA